MAVETTQEYFRKQQVAPQWRGLLRAMAQELVVDADTNSLHALFFNVGQRYASDAVAQFSGLDTIDDLELRLNQFWLEQNWGWVRLVDSRDGIDIAHHAAPLAAAFGEEALGWSIGLLEGFYQTVFAVLGASEKLVVRPVSVGDEGMEIRLRFAF